MTDICSLLCSKYHRPNYCNTAVDTLKVPFQAQRVTPHTRRVMRAAGCRIRPELEIIRLIGAPVNVISDQRIRATTELDSTTPGYPPDQPTSAPSAELSNYGGDALEPLFVQ